MKHEILVYNKTKRRISEKLIKLILSEVLNFLKPKQPVAMAVLVVSSREIRELNKIWREKDIAVDELSFGLNSRKATGFAKQQNRVLELGEIVVSSDKIADKNRFAKILIHGSLHLLGYHHEKSIKKAIKMEWLEEKILKDLLNTNILS